MVSQEGVEVLLKFYALLGLYAGIKQKLEQKSMFWSLCDFLQLQKSLVKRIQVSHKAIDII